MAPPADGIQSPPLGPMALVRFVSELAMLGGLGYVGWQLGGGSMWRLLLAIALPVTAAVGWGAFIGPRAARRLTDPARLCLEVVLFGITVVGLIWYDAEVAAVVLALLYAGGTMHGRAGG